MSTTAGCFWNGPPYSPTCGVAYGSNSRAIRQHNRTIFRRLAKADTALASRFSRMCTSDLLCRATLRCYVCLQTR